MTGSRDNETDFPHILLLTDEQVLQFHKGFVNNIH